MFRGRPGPKARGKGGDQAESCLPGAGRHLLRLPPRAWACPPQHRGSAPSIRPPLELLCWVPGQLDVRLCFRLLSNLQNMTSSYSSQARKLSFKLSSKQQDASLSSQTRTTGPSEAEEDCSILPVRAPGRPASVCSENRLRGRGCSSPQARTVPRPSVQALQGKPHDRQERACQKTGAAGLRSTEERPRTPGSASYTAFTYVPGTTYLPTL